MLPEQTALTKAATFVKERLGVAQVGVVLGSGLGAFADQLHGGRSLSYAEIPGMPISSVSGHEGRLHLGTLGEVSVVCLQGRVHAYEGHSVERTCFAAALLAELGCEVVLLSNAAGGISTGLKAGSLMLLTDHLNLTGLNPLCGPTPWRGPRFLDMSRAYDPALQVAALRVAATENIDLASGIYAGVLGPSYETPAEVTMLGRLGADAVGMSTVLEVLTLRQLGVRVGAISCITNLAAGMSSQPLSHAEVQLAADEASGRFQALVKGWVAASCDSVLD